MRLALIAAVARNGVIGGDGAMPWRLRDDLKRFKSLTMGKPMIMGRKTFQSIGKALPGRDNIVMTRDPGFIAPGVFVVRSLRAGLSLGRHLAEIREADEISIIGGGEIYAQTMPRADRIYLTRVDAEPPGDAHFPELDTHVWREEKTGETPADADNQFACEYFILTRQRR